jgi:hypothetical protein
MIKEITKYIENNVTDLVIGQNLFAGFRASGAPDDSVLVAERSGGIPDFDLPDFLQKPIQILCRAGNYHNARASAQGIYELLHGKSGITLPVVVPGQGYYVDTITANAAPCCIGQDEKGLFEFSSNYIFRIQNV